MPPSPQPRSRAAKPPKNPEASPSAAATVAEWSRMETRSQLAHSKRHGKTAVQSAGFQGLQRDGTRSPALERTSCTAVSGSHTQQTVHDPDYDNEDDWYGQQDADDEAPADVHDLLYPPWKRIGNVMMPKPCIFGLAAIPTSSCFKICRKRCARGTASETNGPAVLQDRHRQVEKQQPQASAQCQFAGERWVVHRFKLKDAGVETRTFLIPTWGQRADRPRNVSAARRLPHSGFLRLWLMAAQTGLCRD